MTTSAHPTLLALLAEVRQEAAGLLSDIDTRVKPKPTRMAPADDAIPGPVWEPAKAWTVRVDDPTDTTPACVFVNHPHTWDDDVTALTSDEARTLGMAFLAAADWADMVRSRDIEGAS
jgi:hypothetical protein